MKKFLVLLMAVCCIHGFSNAQWIDPQDSTVLATFNTEIQKYGWPSLWDASKPAAANWKGLMLDGSVKPYRVTGLSIQGQYISVPAFQTDSLPPCINILKDLSAFKELGIHVGVRYLPPEIGELTNLTTLALVNNKLDKLPEEILKLKNLEVLLLSHNLFTTIPDLNTLSMLTHLSLNSNTLLTSITSNVFTLSNLKTLDVGYTGITSLPETIRNLSSLETLRAGGCPINQLPPSIGDLKNLKELDLNGNKLTTLPAAMGGLSALEVLNVSYNQLTELPSSLSGLSTLRELRFESNGLTAFPDFIAGIRPLQYIFGARNKMQGSIPQALWNKTFPTNIYLDVTGNQLSGKLTIPDARIVRRLHISGNKFLLSDIHPVYTDLKNNGASMEFNPQARIGTFRTVFPATGEDVAITIDNYTHLSGSVYTWYRIPSIESGEQEIVASQQTMNLILADFDPAKDGGIYYCKVTHPVMGTWELVSNTIRVIGENKPPILFVDNIIFRRGSTSPALKPSAQDDYTYRGDLQWNIPASTEHFTLTDHSTSPELKSFSITPTSLQWLGTDTLSVSVRDEHGNTTSKDITITLLDENNDPPVINPIPAIYLKEESIKCEAGTGCDSTWVLYSNTLLNPFVTDDIDNTTDLTYRINQEDADHFAQHDFYISIIETNDDRILDILILSNKDTTFTSSFTLEVTDREGGTSTREVMFVNTLLRNQPPRVSPIGEQQIVKGASHFPALDLNSFASDDHTAAEDLEWLAAPYSGLEATLENGIALVTPKLSTAFVDTVLYKVRERSNIYMETFVKVVYKVLEEGVIISGTITTDTQQPLQHVTLNGFPTEVSTNAQGFYSTQVAPGWSGTITPLSPNAQFTPDKIDVINIQSDLPGQNFTAAIITSVDEDQESKVFVYPNPGKGVFRVRSAHGSQQLVVSVVNSLGGSVNIQPIKSADGDHSFDVNAPSGLYTIIIRAGHETFIRKLIIER